MGSCCDSDWDFPLTDEDLQAIDAVAFSAAAAPSAPSPATDEDLQAIDAAATSTPSLVRKSDVLGCTEHDHVLSQSPPKTRRRLPDSLFSSRQQQQFRSFSLSPCSSNYYSSPFEEIKFRGRVIYCRTAEEVERAAETLVNFVESKKREENGQCALGLDIEWRPSFERGIPQGKAAVMQICGDRNYCHVLHIIHSQIPKTLQFLLEDPTSVKVGVWIANDAAKVLQDYGVSINNLADLSDLANRKLRGEPKNWSLSSLTEMLICRKLPKPKNIRLGNWEVEELSKEQLNYAATDAYVSWSLYRVLSNIQDPIDDKKCTSSGDT